MTTRARAKTEKTVWNRDAGRARVRRAAALWGWIALGGIVLMAAFVLWHLARRGRMVRDRLGPPRDARLPDLTRPARDRAPEAGADR